MNKLLLFLFIISSSIVNAKNGDYYLFTYFNSDKTEGGQVWYAISKDGVNFEPINGGKPVIAADSISVSGAVRDPHILRGKNGWFYQVVTDLNWPLGKWTCRGFVMMRSRDLVNWEHHAVQFPERYAGKDPAKADAVWAPQTIYDPSAGKYMIYFSMHSPKDGPYPTDKVFYAYANEDFSDLENDPQPLFDYNGPTIDTDIVQDKDGVYHCFFNTWGGEFKGTARRQMTFTNFHDKTTWKLLPGRMQPTENLSEGSCCYPDGKGGWFMVYDCFRDHICQFCHSTDLVNWTWIQDSQTTPNYSPKHGTVIRITKKEYKRIVKLLGNK